MKLDVDNFMIVEGLMKLFDETGWYTDGPTVMKTVACGWSWQMRELPTTT
jgi:hypothetical protein